MEEISYNIIFWEKSISFEQRKALYAEFDNDEIHEGWPSTATTEENLATVGQLIEENRRITYEEIQGHFKIGSKNLASTIKSYKALLALDSS